MPKFYMILARKKIIKIPEFLWFLPEKKIKKNSRILRDIYPKNAPILRDYLPQKYFPEFSGARASPCPRLIRPWLSASASAATAA